MLCRNCNNQIPDDSQICPYCSALTEKAQNEKICPFCGAILKSGDAFCLKCGKKVENPEIAEYQSVKPPVRKNEKKKGNGVFIALIIVLSVIIVGLLAFIAVQNYFLNDEQKKTTPPRGEEIKAENVITLEIDAYDSEVYSDYYTIFGTASATELNSTLTVDGENIATIVAGDGTFRWSKELRLYEGSNAFRVMLSDSQGKTKTETVVIYKATEDDDYLFESDRYYINDYDLYGKTQNEVALIRNEIYARHGYIFSTEEYAEYFSQKSWYVPNPDFSEAMFNDIELANKEFLVQYESDRGWR